MLALELANDFAALGPASGQVRAYLAEAGAPDAAAFLADLVIEELVTNTIKYGFDETGPHAIAVEVLFAEGRLTVEVRDHGRAFNPLEQDAPDTSLPAHERGIGGLGIYLVRQMADEVRYERRDRQNVVTATKAFVAAGH